MIIFYSATIIPLVKYCNLSLLYATSMPNVRADVIHLCCQFRPLRPRHTWLVQQFNHPYSLRIPDDFFDERLVCETGVQSTSIFSFSSVGTIVIYSP